MQTLLEGNVIGSILELDKVVPIRLIYPNTQNRNLEDIRKSYLFLPSGKTIPITNLVDITISKGIAQVER